jgi:branched-subunit amino acid transport protein
MTNTAYTLLVFLGMGAVTYFTRYAMLAAMDRELPLPIRRWLVYVPPAVLAALVAPAGLAPAGRVELGPSTVAMIAGAIVAWCTRSVFWTIAGGLAAYWLFRGVGL